MTQASHKHVTKQNALADRLSKLSAAVVEPGGGVEFEKLPRPAVPIMLGLLLENATPEERAGFLATLSPLVRLMWRLSGRLAVALYRRSDGRVGGSAKGLPILLITTPGRVTGRPHTVPVVYFEVDARVPDDAERDRLWHGVVLARAAFFAKYQQKAGRVIPVGVLTRTTAGAS